MHAQKTPHNNEVFFVRAFATLAMMLSASVLFIG